MNFGKNLQNFRKAKNLSQEDLADRMEVSRQALSKWESGSGYPEAEKLIKLCTILDCSLDDLIKGDATPAKQDLKTAYNRLINTFSRQISFAVALILLGLTIFIALASLSAPYSNYGLIVFLIFVTIATPIFILRGIELENFKAKHPHLDNFYTEAEIDTYNTQFSKIISSAVAIILVGLVAFVAVMVTNIFPTECSMPAAIFMTFISISTPLFIYAGIQKNKYNIARYNHENSLKYKTTSDKIGKISAVILILATIIFIFTGITWDIWKAGWLIYPVAILSCGIVAVLLQEK